VDVKFPLWGCVNVSQETERCAGLAQELEKAKIRAEAAVADARDSVAQANRLQVSGRTHTRSLPPRRLAPLLHPAAPSNFVSAVCVRVCADGA
jgi:hypothetical protein